MSFRYNDLDTDKYPWLDAILTHIPVFEAENKVIPYANVDGSAHQRRHYNSKIYEYRLTVRGDNPDQVFSRISQVTSCLRYETPSKVAYLGRLYPRIYSPSTSPGNSYFPREWYCEAVVDGSLEWEMDKILWNGVKGQNGVCVAHSTLRFLSPDPYLYYLAGPYKKTGGFKSGHNEFKFKVEGNSMGILFVRLKGLQIPSGESVNVNSVITIKGPFKPTGDVTLDSKSGVYKDLMNNIAHRFSRYSPLYADIPSHTINVQLGPNCKLDEVSVSVTERML